MGRWYALKAHEGRELALCRYCSRVLKAPAASACFTPRLTRARKRRGSWEYRDVPLYPGYCVIESSSSVALSRAVKAAPRSLELVGGADAPRPIDRAEQRFVSSLMDAGGTIGMSRGFIDAEGLHVVSGPLRGREGLVRRCDRHRCSADVLIPGTVPARTLRVGLEITKKITGCEEPSGVTPGGSAPSHAMARQWPPPETIHAEAQTAKSKR